MQDERGRGAGVSSGSPAREAKEEARGAVGEAAQAGQEKAAHEAERQKDRARHELGSFAGALRRAGEALESEDQRWLGRYTEKAAEEVDRLAGHLERRDLSSLKTEAEDLARRRPELFLGGLYMGGVLLGRFLRSSSPHHHEPTGASPGPVGANPGPREGGLP